MHPTHAPSPSSPSRKGHFPVKLLCLAIGLLAASPILAATRYLDKAATGRNDGSSPLNAWNSVAAMKLKAFESGDILEIQGGDYSTEELAAYFPSKSNIIFRIAPLATQQAVFRAIQFYGTRGCTLDGYTGANNGLLDTAKCMIKATGLSQNSCTLLIRETVNFTIRGVEIDGSAINVGNAGRLEQHGIGLNGTVSGGTIEYCNIHNILVDGINNNIDISPDVTSYTNIVIRYNRIVHVGDDGIQSGRGNISVYGNYVDQDLAPLFHFAHPDGLQINPGQNYVKIYGNLFKNFCQNVFVEYADGTMGGIFIYNNIFISTKTGANADRAVNYSTRPTFTATFLIANNVSYNFVSFIAFNGGISRAANRIIANNIFLNCKLIASPTETGPIGADNIYYNTRSVQYYDTDGNRVSIPGDQFVGAAKYADPGLASPASGDFHAASPLSAIVNAGRTLSEFAVDKDGAKRPLGAAWDIGPYEFNKAHR